MRKRIEGSFVFVFCLFIFALKSPDALTNPQFWAEDGAIFFAQQHLTSTPLIFKPYAGYLHVIPRAIAFIWSGLPARFTPLAYNLSALIIDAALMAFAILRLSRIFPLGLCLLGAFCLPTVGDIFGTMTNIQWFAQFAIASAIFVARASTRSQSPAIRWLLLCTVTLCALSGPFSVTDMLVVIGAWLYDTLITRFRLPFPTVLDKIRIDPSVLAAVLLGAIPQLATMAISKLSGQLRTPEAELTLSAAEAQHFHIDLHNWYSDVVVQPFTAYGFVLYFLFLVVTVLNLFRFQQSRTPAGAVSITLLALGWLSPLLAYAKQHAHHTLSPLSHYWYFLGVVCVCCSAQAFPATVTRFKASLAAPVVLLLLLAWDPRFAMRPALNDLAWRGYAEQIERRDASVTVPLNPNWRVAIAPPNAAE